MIFFFYKSLHKKRYWINQSFTEFTFYQHRQLHKVNPTYNSFIFKQNIKISKLLASSIKNLCSYRFSFSFFLINPHLYSSWGIKNFFYLNLFAPYLFMNNKFYSNLNDSFFPMMLDFNNSIAHLAKNNIFIDFNSFFSLNNFFFIFYTYELSIFNFSFKNLFLFKMLFYFLFFNF